MPKEYLQLPAILDNIRLKKDKSVNIVFTTQELTAAEILKLLSYRDLFGWLLFKTDGKEFEEKDIPKEKSGYEEGKSPAMRLRGVIYRFFEQNVKDEDFEVYYRRTIEKLINQYKEKLI